MSSADPAFAPPTSHPPASPIGGEGRGLAQGGDGRERFVLAHLSDPHVPSPLKGWPHSFLNKRAFGYMSWRLRRARIHRREVLEALLDDLKETRPDHIAVTGDIVNIALPAEFKHAGHWLQRLGPSERVSVVPGNHDAYVPVVWQKSWAAWEPFMTGDLSTPFSDSPSHPSDASVLGRFPYVRRRGPIALIGLSTAEPSMPGAAWGKVGAAQLEQLKAFLRDAENRGLFRVVLLHHPPYRDEGLRRKRLRDARAFQDVVFECGAELILHGHDHRTRLGSMPGPRGPVPIFGVASASQCRKKPLAVAEYLLHNVTRGADGWSLETRARCYDMAAGRFVDAGTRPINVPPSPVSVGDPPAAALSS